MSAMLVIGWFIWMVISIGLIFHYIGFSGLTRMFPEGERGWHFPVQMLTLANFAAAVLANPWATLNLTALFWL